jgi:hypothetical protein
MSRERESTVFSLSFNETICEFMFEFWSKYLTEKKSNHLIIRNYGIRGTHKNSKIRSNNTFGSTQPINGRNSLYN